MKTTVIAQSGQKYALYLIPPSQGSKRWTWYVYEDEGILSLASGESRFKYRARSKMIGALLDAEWEHQRKGRKK